MAAVPSSPVTNVKEAPAARPAGCATWAAAGERPPALSAFNVPATKLGGLALGTRLLSDDTLLACCVGTAGNGALVGDVITLAVVDLGLALPNMPPKALAPARLTLDLPGSLFSAATWNAVL